MAKPTPRPSSRPAYLGKSQHGFSLWDDARRSGLIASSDHPSELRSLARGLGNPPVRWLGAPVPPSLRDLKDPETVQLIAREFCRVVRSSFTPRELREIQRRNLEHRARGEMHVCATHDFSDANMLMADAFQRVGFLDAVHAQGEYIEVQQEEAKAKGLPFDEDRAGEEYFGLPVYEEGCRVWGEAWDAADRAGFDPVRVGLKPGEPGPFTCPRCASVSPLEEQGSDCPLCADCLATTSPFWRGWWAGAEGWPKGTTLQGREGAAYDKGHAKGAEARALGV